MFNLNTEIMKRSIFILTVIAMAGIIAGCEKEESDSADPAQETAAIKAIYTDFSSAVKEGSAENYVSNFTEDAIVMPPGFPSANGKDKILTDIEGIFSVFDAELPWTADEVNVVGDWAFVCSSWEYRLTPKAGGETAISYGKGLDVLQKQADGSWKVHRQCYNFDPAEK